MATIRGPFSAKGEFVTQEDKLVLGPFTAGNSMIAVEVRITIFLRKGDETIISAQAQPEAVMIVSRGKEMGFELGVGEVPLPEFLDRHPTLVKALKDNGRKPSGFSPEIL